MPEHILAAKQSRCSLLYQYQSSGVRTGFFNSVFLLSFYKLDREDSLIDYNPSASDSSLPPLPAASAGALKTTAPRGSHRRILCRSSWSRESAPGLLFIAALILMIVGAWLSSQDKPLKITLPTSLKRVTTL